MVADWASFRSLGLRACSDAILRDGAEARMPKKKLTVVAFRTGTRLIDGWPRGVPMVGYHYVPDADARKAACGLTGSEDAVSHRSENPTPADIDCESCRSAAIADSVFDQVLAAGDDE